MVDKELVEQITEAVVEEISQQNNDSSEPATALAETGSAGPDSANTEAPERVLALVMPGPGDLSEMKNQLQQLTEQGVSLELFLSESLPDDQKRQFKQLSNVSEIFESSLPAEGCFTLVTRCDAILIPSLSMDTLNQINEMEGEDLAGRVAVEALSQDKLVLAPEDSGVASNNSEIQQQYENKLAAAGEKGLRTAPLHELSYELLRSTVDSGELTEVTVCREEAENADEPRMQVARDEDQYGAVLEAEGMRLGTTIGVRDVKQEVGGYIDHTLLNPDATRDEIVQLCEEAEEFGFASVCINPSWVSLCHDLLQGTDVKVCTVIGFPLGATTTATKVQECREAIANGADEIDMVMNIGALKEGDTDYVREDVAAVAEAAGSRTLKVILETGMLSDSQKAQASKICKEAGADFVKTSTGFGPGGAKMNDIALMRRVVGGDMGVKASGGVHSFEEAVDMIAAGASRIGASAGVAIVSGETSDSDY